MPNTKSAAKAMRASSRKHVYNLRNKAKVKTAVKALKISVSQTDKAAAKQALIAAYSALDKAAKRKVIHRNTASRQKSRLAKRLAVLDK